MSPLATLGHLGLPLRAVLPRKCYVARGTFDHSDCAFLRAQVLHASARSRRCPKEGGPAPFIIRCSQEEFIP